MKMQLGKLAAYFIAAGLLTTGFSAPVLEGDVATNAQSDEKRSVGESFPLCSQSGRLAARDLHDTNVGAIEVRPTSPNLPPVLSKRRGSRGSSRGSSRRVGSVRKKRPTKTTSKKHKPAKTTTKKHKPAKGTTKKKPGKGATKKNKQCPKNAPKKCTKKEKDAKGCCKVSEKLEFTKYPKGRQHWTPPKGATARRSEPAAADSEVKASALAKRAPPPVAEGKTEEGGAADSLKTWHVINCIAISGYDNATGKKAMAHINAINAAGKEYDDQFKVFADIVYAWKGPIDVEVRWPHKTAIPEDKKELKPKQKQFEDDIKLWVGWMRNSKGPVIKVHDRPASKREGDMMMLPEGDVQVD